MLGRRDFTKDEVARGKDAVKQQIAAYKKVSKAAPGDFESVYFNSMILALDRLYVHRIRKVTGHDNNALNEVELIVESLMENRGLFRGNNVLKYTAEESVLGLTVGDNIRLTVKEFERLTSAFFKELEAKFL